MGEIFNLEKHVPPNICGGPIFFAQTNNQIIIIIICQLWS